MERFSNEKIFSYVIRHSLNLWDLLVILGT